MSWLFGILIFAVLIFCLGLIRSQANWGGIAVNWIDGWVRLLCRFWHGLKPTQLALPEQGPAIVVANHVSGLDPFLLISCSKRPLRFLIASEEYRRPVLHWLFKAAGCIPVDRTGRPEQALRQALRALERGEVVALFPHGKIHLDSDPPRRIKGGVVRLAKWSDAIIFPVRIDGVAAEGSVALAPFIPSKVQLSCTDPIHTADMDAHAALTAITLAIETPALTKAS